MLSDYAALRLEDDFATDERLLQLFRDAEKKRQSRQLTRFWLVVLSAGVGLLLASLYVMGGPR